MLKDPIKRSASDGNNEADGLVEGDGDALGDAVGTGEGLEKMTINNMNQRRKYAHDRCISSSTVSVYLDFPLRKKIKSYQVFG